MLDHPLSRFSRTRRYVLAVGHSLSIHTGVNHSIYLHNDHGLKRDHRERVCWMNLLGTTDSNSLIPTQASAEEMNQRVGPLKCNIATNASIFFFPVDFIILDVVERKRTNTVYPTFFKCTEWYADRSYIISAENNSFLFCSFPSPHTTAD